MTAVRFGTPWSAVSCSSSGDARHIASMFKVRRRVQGPDHPDTRELRDDLETIRTVLELDDATFELLVE